jgi:hypothetical protein
MNLMDDRSNPGETDRRTLLEAIDKLDRNGDSVFTANELFGARLGAVVSGAEDRERSRAAGRPQALPKISPRDRTDSNRGRDNRGDRIDTRTGDE